MRVKRGVSTTGIQLNVKNVPRAHEQRGIGDSMTHDKPARKRHKAINASQHSKEQWASVFYDWKWSVMVPLGTI